MAKKAVFARNGDGVIFTFDPCMSANPEFTLIYIEIPPGGLGRINPRDIQKHLCPPKAVPVVPVAPAPRLGPDGFEIVEPPAITEPDPPFVPAAESAPEAPAAPKVEAELPPEAPAAAGPVAIENMTCDEMRAYAAGTFNVVIPRAMPKAKMLARCRELVDSLATQAAPQA
jgi:hypothetical protein